MQYKLDCFVVYINLYYMEYLTVFAAAVAITYSLVFMFDL